VITVGVAGLIFDEQRARESLFAGLQQVASPDVVKLVRHMLEVSAQSPTSLATVLATVFLFWAASRLFIQVQEALNLIWGVRVPDSESVLDFVRHFAIKRVISLAMVLGCGALLLASLFLQTLVSALGSFALRLVGAETLPAPVVVLEQLGLAYLLLATLFTIIYRVLPDARVRWADVWVGGLLTAAMTLLGTWLLGSYFTHVAPAWLQGAIGSVAAFVLWTYYLAQVFYLGAAFTREWSERCGVRVVPEAHAELVPPSESAADGGGFGSGTGAGAGAGAGAT
jgi:membrane protein